MLRRIFAFLISLIMIAGMASCEIMPSHYNGKSENNGTAQRDIFAMDTYMTLTAYGDRTEEAIDRAEEKIRELDTKFSAGNPDGEIGKLNVRKQAVLSDESKYVIEYARKIWDMTDGAFNPLIYPIMKEWGFDTKEYHVPEEGRLEELVGHMDMGKLVTDKVTGEISFIDKAMEIDMGGIAKGYTSDSIMEIYREYGLTGGIVSLGGNVQAFGKKPDGDAWRVGIQHPDGEGQLGIINVEDKAVITSGGYERYFEEGGTRYHHIIDPATGYPAHAGLASVTIVSGSGILADGLSTAVYVMGYDKAVKLWREHSGEFDMILYTDDGKQYITEGIEDIYEPADNDNVYVIRAWGTVHSNSP